MDVGALRTWGIAVSAVLIAAALAVALTATQATAPAQTATPEKNVFQIAAQDGGAAPAPVSFVVRFRGQGPIARSQGMAARGDEAQAARQVRYQLTRQRDFSGLCFDRFTLGGAEIVLRSCVDVAASERTQHQQRLLARLRSMRAVEYVDVNESLTHEPVRPQN